MSKNANVTKDMNENQESKEQKMIPATFVLYCDYPGCEFREEMDAPGIDWDDDDYEFSIDDVLDELQDKISDTLYSELNYNELLGVHYTEDDVAAQGHFWYGEVRTSEFGDADLPLNEDIKVCLDCVAEDGTVLETHEIDIENFISLDSVKETLMECGLFDSTDEYIECSLDKFVKETGWHIGLLKGSERIEDVTRWPAPNRRGSWIDEDGTEMYPCLWYGYNDGSLLSGEEDRIWNIDNGLDFWFSDDPERYLVEYDYDGHAGCFGGSIPDIEAIRKECPILLEEDDTEESIDAKVQAYCKKQYKKAHKKMKEAVTKPEA